MIFSPWELPALASRNKQVTVVGYAHSVMIVFAVAVAYFASAGALPSPGAQPTCKNIAQYNYACRCDPACAKYGDCCQDAPYFKSEEQKVGVAHFSCVTLDTNEILMKMSCPADWMDEKIRFNCENPDDSFQDPILDVPITSLRTNITYRNWHCASCHKDLYAHKSRLWPMYFNCTNWLKLDEENLLNHLVYDIVTSSWQLNITDYLSIISTKNLSNSGYFEACHVGVQPPIEVHSVLRPCPRNLVDSCPPDWTDTEVRSQCESYVSYICSCSNSQTYRNYYCGYCNNNGTFKSMVCGGEPAVRSTKAPADFSLLFDWHKLSKRSTCGDETEEYDPLSKTCRKIFNISELSEESVGEMPVSPRTNLENETISLIDKENTLDTNFTICPKFRLEPVEYIIDSETNTVFVPDYNRTYQPNEYRIENDSRLTICAMFGNELVDAVFSWGLFYVTIIGITLSLVFLVLHLLLFFLTPKQRNLSSMNLASLSFSLLLTYTAFLGGWQLEGTDAPCVVAAVLMHYSLLAAFFWMFTIAYDISRVLRESTSKLMVTSGKHWKRFSVYSALSWLVPAAISAAALAVQYSDVNPNGLNPGFGRDFCWFSNPKALLLFCGAPTFIVMLLNVMCFCWSAYIIFSTSLNMRHSSNSQQDFWLYARLALIVGLTWITGFVGSYVNIEAMWYLFVLLNTLQGLFIFLAFSCNMKVWNELCNFNKSFPASQEAHQLKVQSLLNTSST